MYADEQQICALAMLHFTQRYPNFCLAFKDTPPPPFETLYHSW